MENNDNDNKEIEIEHRLVIEEEKIDINDLPEEIRQAMRLFNKKLDKYEQTGDDNLYYELQQDDVAIADGIENWLEDNEADDENEDDSYLQPASQQAAPQQAAPQANNIQEKLLAVVKNNTISVQDLQNIIGREPDYPTEKVGNLIFKKQYLKPFYELV